MAHILIVDDEQSICELLEITFRKEWGGREAPA
jgi:DNA-binding NtrC family response regulator